MTLFEPLASAENEVNTVVYDKYIGARIILDNTVDGGSNISIVKSCVTDINVSGVGVANNNPLLDSRDYEIESENGTTDRLCTNKIAENIYPQLDDEGRGIMKFNEIIDHRKN